jgi:hypothetical protein
MIIFIISLVITFVVFMIIMSNEDLYYTRRTESKCD